MAPESDAARGKRKGHASWSSPAGSAACPDLDTWMRLTREDLPRSEADALFEHCSHCDECLEVLKQTSPALAAQVANEAQESAEHILWRRRLAVQLARTPRGARRAIPFGKFVWWSVSFASIALAMVGILLWRSRQNAPEKLLALAYTHDRFLDLRIPDAPYAPRVAETHSRGDASQHEIASLLNARATIEQHLEKSPSDPYWLALRARADLLDENYDAAIDILDRMLASGPVTASLLTDDASAYFQRGIATGSENDRATALDYLRRADELAPDNPVVLFNEALVMEDRAQLINAVETWNRYLKFERDPGWLAEGREHLARLEKRLDQLKSHESRMLQHLATPQAMAALAADPAVLAGMDEELSSTLLPRLLDAAFPLPVDRSRGSPCDARCSAARTLLHSLAASLEKNHQDPWLSDFLPSAKSPVNDEFVRGAQALGQAIRADTQGDYAGAARHAMVSRTLFRKLGNAAGEDRAEVERVYALQRSYTFASCQKAAEALLARVTRYGWIRADATALDAGCDMNPGVDVAINPLAEAAVSQASAYHYVLLELRARNALAGAAAESGDSETALRIIMGSIRQFYEGDYPAFRVATTMGGLGLIEDGTPRKQLDLLVNQETFALFELTHNRAILAEQRVAVIRAAIRAGALQTAQKQMRIARKELALAPHQKGLLGFQAESEIDLAGMYLDRGDLKHAGHMLDDAHNHMVGMDNPLQLDNYAVTRGELDLALGHPENAEPALRTAVLQEERQARGAGRKNIIFARQDRDLYATLAGVWLAEKRPGIDILAMWERYRLRILGQPVPKCAQSELDCLKPQLESALEHEQAPQDRDWLVGQIVLRDRVLLYRTHAHHVAWSEVPLRGDDVLAAAAALEREVSSPLTSQTSIDRVAQRLGSVLMQGVHPQAANALLVIEPDPQLGNMPWPAVETADGAIGLHFSLEEAPTVLLPGRRARPARVQDQPLVVGASVGAGVSTFLPEALQEARTVAGLDGHANLLLAAQATEPRVAAHIASASLIHFAGHATQYDGETRLLLAPTGTAGDKPYLDSKLLIKDPPKDARLVVLSACASGKNEAGWNHGMGDIVDTLAALGVPDVVATRWQIDSASAVSVMDAFYRGLASGRSVPEALTAARQSLVRDPKYRHPYYWAAYYASGAGNMTLREVLHANSR